MSQSVVDEILNPEVLDTLKKSAGIFELYHVTTFRGYRHAKNGEDHKVRIEVWDRGGRIDPHLRFHLMAVDEDNGKQATGNADKSVREALVFTHWFDLD